MSSNARRAYWPYALLLIAAGIFLSWRMMGQLEPSPMVIVDMSSTVNSIAQIYYDVGSDFNEPESVTVPVPAGLAFHELRFVLPRKTLIKLRFDPLTTTGVVQIRRMRIVDGEDKTVREIRPSEIKQLTEIKEMTEVAGGLRIQTFDNARDPAVYVPLDRPVPLPRPAPSKATLLKLALLNAPFVLLALVLVTPVLRAAVFNTLSVVDVKIRAMADGTHGPNFVAFDRIAIWFYLICGVWFVFQVAGDLNGSSMAFNTKAIHQYGPQPVLLGTAKGIRADEWNFMTPDMLYQVFRAKPFDAVDSPFGKSYAALLGNVPVKHISTIFRPQYWGFFVLPADYGFAFFWQMKWLLMITGVFTLLLVLTGSSVLSIGGALWLFFSAGTQWKYSWPSMLPEMCGLFCFTLVLAMYLAVGGCRIRLAVFSPLLAACALNFAMCAYLPHLAPYCIAGLFLFGGWLYSRRERVLSSSGRVPRALALGVAVAVIGVVLGIVYKDVAPAVAGIGATEYPGHRSIDGGEYWLPDFASHYFAPFEDEHHFPPALLNISEASGFLWLAPFSLLCWGPLRNLSKERKILLACLWAPALILLVWDTYPIPAALGHLLFLDTIPAERTLPAMGFLNTAIVMLALSGPVSERKMSLSAKFSFLAVGIFMTLAIANSMIDSYFSLLEVFVIGSWLVLLVGLLWDMRPRAFLATALAPCIYCFALINPVARGIGAITDSDLYHFTQTHPKVRDGKWLVITPDEPYGIFSACGLDTYTGMHYVPPVQDFKTFERHGVDTAILNSGGMLNAKLIARDEKTAAESMAEGTVQWDVNPLDSLVKEVGIKYVALDQNHPPAAMEGLMPLSPFPISGFWLYELPAR